LTDGSQGRYYAVRNLDFWMTQAAPQAAVKHLEDWGMKQTGKKAAKY
jgi:hypothetical protein